MVQHSDLCMGCGGCEIVCPVGAIRIEMSADGFWRPTINKTICVDCGKCDSVCPVDVVQTNQAIQAYGFKSNDKQILRKSASGGFGYELSKAMIGSSSVCSVEYDPSVCGPRHTVADSIEELDKKRNSIYLQSYTVNGFREILKHENGVVFGSPCQISLLNNLLGQQKRRDKFLLIDFFCHGVPSYNVWKKYVDDHKEVFDFQPDVVFRSKKNGWGSFTIECKAEDKSCYFDKAKDDDIFFRIFLENMALNKCCYSCPYHANNSAADIRIGDLWGEKYKNDTEGITGILAFTEKGRDAVSRMNVHGKLTYETIDDVLAGQIQSDLPIPSCREKLIKELQLEKTLHSINSSLIFRYKLTRKINRLLGRNYI